MALAYFDDDEALPRRKNPHVMKKKKDDKMSKESTGLLSNIKGFVEKRPFVSMFIGAVVAVGVSKYLETDPLEPKALTKYRVVYEHSNDRDNGRGETCGQKSGYFWYAEELNEGLIFDTWETMHWCDSTESGAMAIAESTIKKRLKTESSKLRTYQAFVSKEDVVRFEPTNKEID